jgi:transposase-like protein
MGNKKTERRQFTPEQKLNVVLESLQRDTTLEAVSKKFGIVSSVINRWRKEFKANATITFSDKRNPKSKAEAQGYKPGESPDELKSIIGDLTVQIEILKKVSGLLG